MVSGTKGTCSVTKSALARRASKLSIATPICLAESSWVIDHRRIRPFQRLPRGVRPCIRPDRIQQFPALLPATCVPRSGFHSPRRMEASAAQIPRASAKIIPAVSSETARAGGSGVINTGIPRRLSFIEVNTVDSYPAARNDLKVRAVVEHFAIDLFDASNDYICLRV